MSQTSMEQMALPVWLGSVGLFGRQQSHFLILPFPGHRLYISQGPSPARKVEWSPGSVLSGGEPAWVIVPLPGSGETRFWSLSRPSQS